jgi:hypothetical protein
MESHVKAPVSTVFDRIDPGERMGRNHRAGSRQKRGIVAAKNSTKATVRVKQPSLPGKALAVTDEKGHLHLDQAEVIDFGGANCQTNVYCITLRKDTRGRTMSVTP